MAKNTKPPLRRVSSDDLTVVLDGTTYNPHAGEAVWFRPRVGLSTRMLLIHVNQLYAKADKTEEDSTEIGDLLVDAAVNHLAPVIAKWTWTDDAGSPMPPLTAETARQLDIGEVMWLLTVACSGRSESDQKNDGDPSSTGATDEADHPPKAG